MRDVPGGLLIPDKYLYGKEHGGWVQLMKHFEAERLLCAAMYLGQAETAFADLCAYANSRIQFGQPIGKFQLIQEKVCRDKIILRACAIWCSVLLGSTTRASLSASMRIFASCSALKAIGRFATMASRSLAVWAIAPTSYAAFVARCRVGRIGAGSSEILTKTIAKDVLREAGQYGGGTRALGI